MKKNILRPIVVSGFLLLTSLFAKAQVAVTITNPGNTTPALSASYTSLANAISALDGITAISGPVTLTCAAGSETAPAGGFVINYPSVTTASNTVTILGTGTTITASASQAAGSITDAVFKVIGADFLTLQGFTMQENAANTTSAVATNNMTEWGVALLYRTLTDGAQNNTILNNTISLNRTYLNTFGIYSNTRHSSTVATTTAEVTSAAGANSFNKVYGNMISNVNYGVIFIGAGTTLAAIDNGNDIGGASAATGNTITNWGGGAAASSYISLTGSNYCIFDNQQINDNISFNTVTSAIIASSATTGGILKNYSVASPTSGTITTTFNNNTVTIVNNPTAATTGTVIGINSQGLTPLLSTATISINNNTVQNCLLGGSTSTTNGLTGITNLSLPGILNINGNIVLGNAITATTATSGTMAAIINTGGANTINIVNNIVRGLASTATSGQAQGISNSGAAATAINITGNQLGNAGGGFFSTSTAASGSLFGISNSGGAGTCALAITGNNVTGITYSAAASAAQSYIINSAATLSQNISTNTFTNLNVNTTGSVTFISNNVSVPATGTQTVNSNSIVGTFNKGGAGGTVTCYTTNASSLAGSVVTNSNNNFSNVTLTGATTVLGINNTDGGSPTKTINNNTLSNWTCGTNSVTMLNINFGTSTVANNTVSNITATASITGLVLGSSGLNYSVSGNNINTLNGGGASTVTGINTSNSSSTSNIFANRVYSLTGNNAGTLINGISVTGGTTNNISNNFVSDLTAPSATSTNAVVGINVTGGTTLNLLYNTIYPSSASALTGGATFGASGIFLGTTSGTQQVRDNIVNISGTAVSGYIAALKRVSGTAGTKPSTITASNNIYNATYIYGEGTTLSSATNVFYVSGGTSGTADPSFNTGCGLYKIFMAETSTFTENNLVAGGTTGTFTPSGTSFAKSNAAATTPAVTTDFASVTRNSPSDIGALEFAGTGTDATAPVIAFTNIPNSNCPVVPTLSATITDASGIDVTTGTKPRLYYKLSTEANALTGNTNANNGWKFVESGNAASPFTFSPDYTLLTSMPTNGNTIQYFVVAQDLAATPNVGNLQAGFASGFCPTTVALTAPAFPLQATPVIKSYNVNAAPTLTVVASPAAICVSGTTTLTLSGYTADATSAILWETSTNGGATFTAIGGATSTTFTTPVLTSANSGVQYRASVTCSGSAIATSAVTTIVVNNPQILTTTPGSRCGTGTVILGATATAGNTLNWYASATGGAPLGTGTSFTTPAIPVTTNYFVEASAGAAQTAPVGTSSTTAFGESIYRSGFGMGDYKHQILFTAAELTAAGFSAGNLTSLSVNVTTSGSGSYNNYTIRMANVAAGTLTSTFASGSFTTVFSAATFTPVTSGASVHSFSTPFNWDGSSNVLIDICYNISVANTTTTLSANSSATTNTQLLATTNACTATSGTLMTLRPIFTFTESGCASSRTSVAATVTPAPAITVTSSAPNGICPSQGTTTAMLTAASSNAGYTYTWSPAGTLSSSTGTTVTATPAATTTYTVSANDASGGANNGCVNSATVGVTVGTILPSALTVTPATSTVCPGTPVNLTAAGGTITNAPVFTELANTLPATFSLTNTAGTGTANLNSTYFSEGTGSVLFNTASTNADVQYAMNTNADLSAATAAQLSFSHIAAMESPTSTFDAGYVQYSTNGGSTWTTFPTSSYAGAGTLITSVNSVATTGVVFSTRSYANWISTFTGSIATPGTGPATALWKTETINVPAAALTSQFRIRFRYTTDGSTNYFGWLLDNIRLTANIPTAIAWTPATGLNMTTGTAVTATPATTTAYVATANYNGCTSTNTATVTVPTGAANAYLATASTNGTGLNTACDDLGWTYYSDPANPARYLFGVSWDPASTGANAAAKAVAQSKVQLDAAVNSVTNASTGTFVMQRYWDVNLNGASMTGPVNVRFFYDPTEKTATDAAAAAFATSISGTVGTSMWFKTTGVAYNPSNVTPGGITQGAIQLTDVSGGATLNGVTYAQFNGITSFSGGTWAVPVNNPNPLPVVLKAIVAKAVGATNRIDWSTSVESSIGSYVVERSDDGRSFSQIATVSAHNRPSDYSVVDAHPVQGINYYRLHIMELNGQGSYSRIVTATQGRSTVVVMNAYPNPATDKLVVDVAGASSDAMLSLKDLSGRILMTQQVQNGTAVFSIASLPAGTYFAVYAGDNGTQVLKVSKL